MVLEPIETALPSSPNVFSIAEGLGVVAKMVGTGVLTLEGDGEFDGIIDGVLATVVSDEALKHTKLPSVLEQLTGQPPLLIRHSL